MNTKKKKKERLIFCIFLVLMLCFYITNPFMSIRFILEDLLFLHTTSPSPSIFVIGIDNKTLKTLGPFNSWTRENIAGLIQILNGDESCRPSVIGVDIMFFGETNSDHSLTEAVSACDNIVFASEIQFSTTLNRTQRGYSHLDPLSITGISLPQPPLDTLANTGFTNAFLDQDGVVRRSLLSVDINGTTYHHFAEAVYQKYLSASNQTFSPVQTDANHMWTIPYQAKPGTYIQGISFIDVLDGRIPPSFFEDSIVLIGAAASGMMDSYTTPIDRSTPMYGVEINANMIQALMEGESLLPVPILLQMVLFSFLFSVCFLIYQKGETSIRILCLLLSTAGWVAFAGICGRRGYLWDILYFPLFSILFYSVKIIRDYIEEHQKRLLTLETFERYISPEVAKHLLSSGGNSLNALQESRRHIAVMFVDIRGFTPLSESLPPEDVTAILNEYLTLTSTAIFNNKGTVDKFMGDATMALFNAPSDLEDYSYAAVQTALDIMREAAPLKSACLQKYGREIQFGIGIHCGDAMVGSIGAPFRMDYTAIGDTVNTAARLESIATPGQILISEAICHAVGERVQTTYLGTKNLKGKEEPFAVYEVSSLS